VSGRRRHPRKDLEQVIREAEELGWRVQSKTGYFKLLLSSEALQDRAQFAIGPELHEEPPCLAGSPGVLGIVNVTLTARAWFIVTDESSVTKRTLSPDDLERFLDDLNDALVLQVVGDVTVGASLRDGWIEVAFSLDGASLIDAQTRATYLFGMAYALAVDRTDRRLAGRGGRVEMRSLDTHTEATALVGA
jgi:hypothetical protein